MLSSSAEYKSFPKGFSTTIRVHPLRSAEKETIYKWQFMVSKKIHKTCFLNAKTEQCYERNAKMPLGVTLVNNCMDYGAR